MSERRGHWYLLTGVILGIVFGLLIAWWVAPVQYMAASPASLRADFKDEYRYMIAAAYASTGNIGRARARLALLEDKNSIQSLGDQAKRMLANNIAPSVVRNVSALADALQVDVPPTETLIPVTSEPSSTTTADESTNTAVSTQLSVTATLQIAAETPTLESISTVDATATPLLPTSTPIPTSISTVIVRSTHTPTFTPGPPFNLSSKPVTFCEPTQPGLLQISLKDSNDQPAAGVELVVTWAGGEEHFFSGLKPELGNGYADFVMSPDIEYALSLSNGNTRVTTLKAPACTTKEGASYIGGIHLEFKQP